MSSEVIWNIGNLKRIVSHSSHLLLWSASKYLFSRSQISFLPCLSNNHKVTRPQKGIIINIKISVTYLVRRYTIFTFKKKAEKDNLVWSPQILYATFKSSDVPIKPDQASSHASTRVKVNGLIWRYLDLHNMPPPTLIEPKLSMIS